MNIDNYFVVDVESDGPIPGFTSYSMVCFGAVHVASMESFYGKTHPIGTKYDFDALSVSGFTRNQHLEFDDPKEVMIKFANWIETRNFNSQKVRPIFWSDNLAFDWQWINWYFHTFLGKNIFGHSGRRINDLYSGFVRDCWASNAWKKKYRITKHTHNPVDDAKGNAEALKTILTLMKTPS